MLPIRVKLIYGCLFFVICLVLFGSYILVKAVKSTENNQLSLANIEKRIALDLTHLNLPDDFLKHSGSKEAVIDYLAKLNSQLKETPIFVYSIEGITEFPARADLIEKQLQTPQKVFTISFVINNNILNKNDIAVFILVCLFSLAISYLVFLSERTKLQVAKQVPEPESNSKTKPILIVDLQNKTLAANCSPDKPVALANKPLCFYLALVEFCTENPDVVLNQNKDVPEELLTLANKYFYRLVELGHTVRKRPNFTNSLEKTLSEIRAALDDVWQDQPEVKDVYYPPKAHGEGSRSRLHHYGLKNITLEDIEVIGK
ncbi:hypothetical protein ACSFVZ_05825 [Pseudoalteromonas sp. SYSU M81236]|jgi:hypothetical protein|uniref:hypothetical protein n=1 Tax=Pseudoalteromonas sp. SYSU M81236 TaxID=3447014 RepID=UPI003F0323C4